MRCLKFLNISFFYGNRRNCAVVGKGLRALQNNGWGWNPTPTIRRLFVVWAIYTFPFYSEYIGVDRYLSPVSGRRTTIFFPLFSGLFARVSAA